MKMKKQPEIVYNMVRTITDLKLKREKIDNIHEECQCEYCGFPMYVGEDCWTSEVVEKIYCGVYCAKLDNSM